MKTEEPKSDGAKTEGPKAGAPKTEGPKTEAKPEAPKVEAPPEQEAPEEVVPTAAEVRAQAEPEMAKLDASAAQVVAQPAPEAKESKPKEDKAKPEGTSKSKPREKTGGGGAKKTHGPEDLVATYGTVGEAAKRQGSVEVNWVEGLKAEERHGKTHKTNEEVDSTEKLEMKSQSIPVHEKLVPVFSSVFNSIRAKGDWKHILERPWAHNARQNRNKPTEWSVHSWGTAMDVNPATNPNSPGAKGYSPSARQNIIAEHFKAAGFTWLKDSDAMHYQYRSGGTPKISDEEIDAIVADDGVAERDKTFPGTSRESLAANTQTNLKRKQGELTKVQKLLAKAQGKPLPTNARKLKKHLDTIKKLEDNVKALEWWSVAISRSWTSSRRSRRLRGNGPFFAALAASEERVGPRARQLVGARERRQVGVKYIALSADEARERLAVLHESGAAQG